MQPRIAYSKPSITDLEIRYATAANGWGERCYDDITRFENAAEAIGSVSHARRAGSIGGFGAFSFHGTKTLTTGEGSMLVTNDADLYERLLTLSNHGRARDQPRQFWPDLVGFKYRMHRDAARGAGGAVTCTLHGDRAAGGDSYRHRSSRVLGARQYDSPSQSTPYAARLPDAATLR
jgi:hypothetical protein